MICRYIRDMEIPNGRVQRSCIKKKYSDLNYFNSKINMVRFVIKENIT